MKNSFLCLQVIRQKFLQVDDRKGKLAVGYDADLVIWNPEEKFEVKPAEILHRYDCSPYNGQHLFGTIQHTIVNGTTVYQNKKVIHKNGGQLILHR